MLMLQKIPYLRGNSGSFRFNIQYIYSNKQTKQNKKKIWHPHPSVDIFVFSNNTIKNRCIKSDLITKVSLANNWTIIVWM